ncbi:MAG: PQQ-dependent sugar dehydrogenase [Gemmatimonadaceae bacterium]|nr:PQQ-dependent sugar dehydrogenase [Gemmatimonadaceae bacterium]
MRKHKSRETVLAIMAAAAAACADSNAGTARAGLADSAASIAGAGSAIPVAAEMRLERVGGRFDQPLQVVSPPGDPRLFVVEQDGRIRLIRGGSVVPAAFLDISTRVRSGGEQGLLSMAFHPGYRTNGQFFVNFTDRNGDTHVERFMVSSNPDVADPASAKLILKIDQPYSNHNGGLVMFGADGMLYVGMGDGGSGGDPRGNGQDPRALLGKILRIDVSRGDPYSIPPGNPFADGAAGRREIWATGMRNPWRFSFDRSASLLYIADVGQNEQEEISVVPANRAGVNFGWNIMEGDRCYRPRNCRRDGLEMPALTYGRDGGSCSVTGGFVYRGKRIPAIAGHYFYSDYCAGWLRSFRYQNGAATDRREWKTEEEIGNVTSFGEDAAGELYIVTHGGRVYRMIGVN